MGRAGQPADGGQQQEGGRAQQWLRRSAGGWWLPLLEASHSQKAQRRARPRGLAHQAAAEKRSAETRGTRHKIEIQTMLLRPREALA